MKWAYTEYIKKALRATLNPVESDVDSLIPLDVKVLMITNENIVVH